ncbi:hypothetical protein HCN51_31625 [Nonomuraea sp. FMUSA5-5]|uniref:DUF2256 domain-containing protein n=1 Tax=Nonomuraea composti TaxID=2720023 RepID=A0ABX1BBK3_9ACTN|nr:hypothetical protein [Nonomuraea sp. FMUSA5-5]NJP93935.1 hypothetical protein [Nonomuraea sp. FMUSA5-5]
MAEPARPLPPPPAPDQPCLYGAHPAGGWRWYASLRKWERICMSHAGRAVRRGDYIPDDAAVPRHPEPERTS